MKKLIFCICTMLGGLMLMSGCDKDQITSFPRQYSAVNFMADSVSYSFLGNQSGVHIEEIKVGIMGDSTGYDRQFNVVVNEDSSTAIISGYEILGGVVKAGQFEGYLSVKLFNSPRIQDTVVTLKMRLSESEDFIIGNAESDELTLYWTNKVVVPTWGFVLKNWFCQFPSTTAYLAVVNATGYTEIDFDLYREIGLGAMRALGEEFGDYVRQYNATHEEPLTHEDGPAKGQPINPVH